MIETLEDIIEELADKFGIYGTGPGDTAHPADCKCRICFTAWLRNRIERAVEVEQRLQYATEQVEYCQHCQQERPMMISKFPGESQVAIEIHCAFCGRYIRTTYEVRPQAKQ